MMIMKNLTITLPLSSFLMNVGHSMKQCAADAVEPYSVASPPPADESQYGDDLFEDDDFPYTDEPEENFLEDDFSIQKDFINELENLETVHHSKIPETRDIQDELQPRPSRLAATEEMKSLIALREYQVKVPELIEWFNANLKTIEKLRESTNKFVPNTWQPRNLEFGEYKDGCPLIRWIKAGSSKKEENKMFVHMIDEIRLDIAETTGFTITVPNGKRSRPRTFKFKCKGDTTPEEAVKHLNEYRRLSRNWVFSRVVKTRNSKTIKIQDPQTRKDTKQTKDSFDLRMALKEIEIDALLETQIQDLEEEIANFSGDDPEKLRQQLEKLKLAASLPRRRLMHLIPASLKRTPTSA
jgi:DNA replication protein DnaD